MGAATADVQLTKSKEITDTEYALISIYGNDIVRVFATSANMGPMWGRPEIQKFLQRQGSTADLRLYNAQMGAQTALNNFVSYDTGTDTVEQMWAQLDQMRKVRIALMDAEAEQLSRIRARLAGTFGMGSPYYTQHRTAEFCADPCSSLSACVCRVHIRHPAHASGEAGSVPDDAGVRAVAAAPATTAATASLCCRTRSLDALNSAAAADAVSAAAGGPAATAAPWPKRRRFLRVSKSGRFDWNGGNW